MCAFAFSCGVILLYRLTVLPPPVWLLVFTLPTLLWFLPNHLRPFTLVRVFLFGLALGVAWSGLWAYERLQERLPSGFEGQKTAIAGYVCDLPQTGSFDSIRFSFCVTRWYGHSLTPAPNNTLPKKLRLAWYGQPEGALPDHRLRLEVVLKQPHGTLNPEGFRYEDWLFRKGYRATGSVRSAQPDPSVTCSLQCQYHRFHIRLAQWVDDQFAEAQYHPLLASLLIGNRGHLSSRHWEVLKATGTIHLVAISGLHLGLVALGTGFVVRRLLLAVSTYCLSEGFVRFGVFLAVVLCCTLYALAAGFTVPTRRALVMVTVGGWLLLMARQVSAWHSIIVALGLVLLLDPFAPLDQGFWLSFGAVSVLVCVFAGRLGGTGWLAGLVLAQGAVFAGLWPILEGMGQGQPVAGLLANVLAIPWVSLVVMPTLIAGGLAVALFPGLSGLIIPAMDGVLGVIWSFLAWVAGIRWPDLGGTLPEIAGLALLVMLVITVPIRLFRAAGAVFVLAWVVLASGPSDTGNPRVSSPEVRIWDVGQGLSAMLRIGDKVVLYDTGPEVEGVFSAVESVLLPNLRALGIRRIDTLVISHADNDHSGGIGVLVDAYDIGRILTGEPEAVREKLERHTKDQKLKSVQVQSCGGGESLTSELSLYFWQANDGLTGNDASCVLTARHETSGIEWIFPGDISAATESLYLQARESTLAAKRPAELVMIAPHHGSKTSSSIAWVSALNPDKVVYTAGYRHRYGHPHPDITARYRAAGAEAFNTACSGALTMTITGDTIKIEETRNQSAFWISGPGQARDQCKIL
ncbi:DNA internalization-related competence protein ComEC/Rec2 [Marinobacter sp. 2_MG-2023]|uniref:DNA internalization-related competence protein ComEC/Rec2 n=1 Tax=Marinobacter sp. 2_MG-2023 TaxID=3062679 RepID=UPI0026E439CF|nr:DNA internalization-related competence protein ComEC/Rec2 [Marinobacter sp. 2_MG-2023]MDO6440560.1 DNA internalization-related competence protein ComEC/Rec2 [Marinobacter sp. 2_MG-2023]